jgi:putative signal transducing protein
MAENLSSISVFAGSSAEAAIVRSFLESNGIAARLADEHIGTMAPHLAAGGGAGAVKVLVEGSDAARAKQLLAERDQRA